MTNDTEAVRGAWGAVAGGWERYETELAAFTAPVRTALIEALAPGPDDVVLELAAGTGRLSRTIADRVREVHGTDLAPGMVAAADRAARGHDLANVTFAVADAQDLPYGDDSADAVVCQMGLMLMPDPEAASSEIHRVLRPGGRLAVATWGPPERNPWLLLLGAALLQHGHGRRSDPLARGGVFSLSTPEAVSRLLTGAGFRDVRTVAVTLHDVFDRFEDFWERQVATGGPLRATLDGLGPAETDAVRGTCRAACEGFRDGDVYRFTGEALVTAARA